MGDEVSEVITAPDNNKISLHLCVASSHEVDRGCKCGCVEAFDVTVTDQDVRMIEVVVLRCRRVTRTDHLRDTKHRHLHLLAEHLGGGVEGCRRPLAGRR